MNRTRPVPSVPANQTLLPRLAARVLSLPGTPQALFSELLKQRRAPLLEPEAEDAGSGAADAEAPPAPVGEDEAMLCDDLSRLPEVTHQEDRPERSWPDAPPELAPTPPVQASAALRVDEPWRRMAHDVAHTIAAFCNDPAVNNSEGWSVQMELRPDVVANTTLHLTLSPHWLVLRFHARDPQSHDLLSKSQQDLIGILETSLERKRDIAISFGPS